MIASMSNGIGIDGLFMHAREVNQQLAIEELGSEPAHAHDLTTNP